MDKRLLLVFYFVLVSFPVAASEKEVLDYNFWAKLPQAVKVMTIAGFLEGYLHGMIEGAIDAHSGQGEATMSKSQFLEPSEPIYERLKGRSPDYFVNEIELFYQRFPSCKEKDFFPILRGLVSVIGRGEKPVTYKQLGDRCQKLPK